MEYSDVKFLLIFNEYEFSSLDDVFKISKSFLNWKFDEKFNAYHSDEEIDYQVTDVSNLEDMTIDDSQFTCSVRSLGLLRPWLKFTIIS